MNYLISRHKIITIIFFAFASFFVFPNNASALTCAVRVGACNAGETALLRMQATDNSHAGFVGSSAYNNLICCSEAGVTVGVSCSGNYDVFLKLSATDNAHVEKNTFVNYANNACISVNTGSVVCGYSAADCVAPFTCLARISADTNAHIGSCSGSSYTTRVCCKYTAVACVPSCAAGSCNDGCGGSFCNGNACNDGNACTDSDVCSGGTCSGTPEVCGNGVCRAGCETTATCPGDCPACVPSCPGGCADVGQGDGCGGTCPNNTGNACNDGNACTNSDTCSGGSCSGSAITCNDSNVCTDDSCNPASGCVFTNNTSSCNDGKSCTSSDVCSGGVCSGTVNCANYCSGLIYYTGGGCDAAGNCVFGSSDDCSDTNICTNNFCSDATGCSIINNTNLCDDSDPCTYDDVCGGGVCGGTLEVCGNNFCRVGCETTASCPADCKCGDGIINGAEICDKNGDVGCGGATPACKTDCSGCIGCTLKSNLVFMGKPVICIVTETIKWILSIAGRLILLILILSGIYYVTSGDNPEKQEKAKKIISYAIIGLVIVLVSYGLLALIDRIFAQS